MHKRCLYSLKAVMLCCDRVCCTPLMLLLGFWPKKSFSSWFKRKTTVDLHKMLRSVNKDYWLTEKRIFRLFWLNNILLSLLLCCAHSKTPITVWQSNTVEMKTKTICSTWIKIHLIKSNPMHTCISGDHAFSYSSHFTLFNKLLWNKYGALLLLLLLYTQPWQSKQEPNA